MILLMTHQENVRDRVLRILQPYRLEVAHVSRFDEVPTLLNSFIPSLVLLDVSAGFTNCDEAFARWGDINEQRPFALLGFQNYYNAETQQCLMRHGAIRVFDAQCSDEELALTIHHVHNLLPKEGYGLRMSASEKESILRAIKNSIRENINVEMLADNLHMSRSSLQRACLRHFNKGPKYLITENKLGFAVELIGRGANNVSSLAYAVGYSSVNNFIAAFKHHKDITPKEFMKQARLKQPAA